MTGAGWLTDAMESQRLCEALRLQLFFEILVEGRKGAGRTDTNTMTDSMEGREFLGRVHRHLREWMDKEWRHHCVLESSNAPWACECKCTGCSALQPRLDVQ